jgi:hypothetical protein
MRADGPAHRRQRFFLRSDRTQENPGVEIILLKRLSSTAPICPRRMKMGKSYDWLTLPMNAHSSLA